MSDSISLIPGDRLRVERRYLVDGVVNTAMAEGSFAGVQHVGTVEYVVLRDEAGETKLIPLANVSEITLVATTERAAGAAEAAAGRAEPAWDPAVG